MKYRTLAATLALAWLAAVLAACSQQYVIYRDRFVVAGMPVTATLYGADRRLAQRAFDALQGDLRYVDVTLNPRRPNALARINLLLPTQDAFSAPPSVLPLITQAIPLYRASGGLFNPAIGKLTVLWGFDGEAPPAGPPPDPKTIAQLVARRPSMDDLVLRGIDLRSTNPAVRLDFDRFAWGYGLDMAAAHLRRIGVRHALIELGNSAYAIGHEDGHRWRTALRDPRGSAVMAWATLNDGDSLSTASRYEHSFVYHGTRYCRLIDPRTGYPAQGMASVTVIDRLGTRAAAAATALFVAGPQHWQRVARAMGVKYVLLVARDGTVYMSPAMAQRVHFTAKPEPRIVLRNL